MTIRKSKKEQITELVFNEIPESFNTFSEISIDQLLFRWWLTGRHSDNLRLTDEGHLAFKLANLEYYDFYFNIRSFNNTRDLILQLSKKIQCPYYLGSNLANKPNQYFIRLFDSKIAMMLNLYGDLKEYLDSVKIRN